MRRLCCGLAVVACLVVSGTGTAFAGTPSGPRRSFPASPSGCKKTSYRADGGYYSQGHFYPEPNDDVTLITMWCYADGTITSYSVHHTTNIPKSSDPRLSTSEVPADGGSVLDVQINGSYNSGVLNNTGIISIVGDVTALGRHHFVNASGSGG